MKFDAAVIGGGPGGYTAAEAISGTGRSVVLFEKNLLGGTCLNRGCMPTKAMLRAAETFREMNSGHEIGVMAENVRLDFPVMQQWKNKVVQELRDGVARQMKTAKVTVVYGEARVTGEGTVSCGGETYEVSDIVIAAGSKVSVPPIPGRDLAGVYDSDDLLEGDGVQLASLIIIGGGVVGIECASVYQTIGTDVVVLEAMDQILPLMDREIAQRVGMSLKKKGTRIETKARVSAISGEPGSMKVTFTDKKGKEQSVTAEGVLMAAGRRANTEGLFAPDVQPETERGAILGDEAGRTSIPHIYVIGDAKARNIQLAHVAQAQALNAAAAIDGKPLPMDLSVIPSCVYTSPEAASVGLSEEAAKAEGKAVITAKYLTGANGKCVIDSAESGYVKLIAEAETGRIAGAQLVCPRATDLIAELALAVQRKLTIEELFAVIHPHPTFSEMIHGAAGILLSKF